MMGGDEIRRCTSVAPASRSICTVLRVVVPRTMESSTTTRRLPAMMAPSGLNLSFTPSWRISWLGWIKERPT